MTDAEKELRRLAQSCENDPLRVVLNDFKAAMTPAAVLALLDRIEVLEKQAAEAELKGAKAERERNGRIVERLGFMNLASVIRAPRFGEP